MAAPTRSRHGVSVPEESRAEAARAFRAALLVVGAATLIHLAFAAYLPLFPDETYYWEWSRRLAPGYFDHPPGIAYLIALGTRLWGAAGAAPSPLAVRLAPVLCGFLASLAVLGIARRTGGARAALYAALAICAMPLAATGLVLATPDAPLMGATAAGVYAVVRAVQSPLRSRASLGWWIVAGIALGGAFTSKYTAILLPVGVVIAIVADPRLRARFGEPGPYVACLVATLIFLPVLLWNVRHDWLSFAFQLEHGLGRMRGAPLKQEGELIGGQVALATPILFAMMAAAVWQGLRATREPAFRLLAILAVTMWGFFVVSAWRKPVEANWPAPAYIPAAAILGATLVRHWSASGERWVRWGIGLAAAVTAVIYAHAMFNVLPLVPRRDPIARAYGFDAMAAAMQRAVVSDSGRRAWFGADRYQDASEIAFHLPGQPEVFSLNLSGRRNQYDLWPGFPARALRGDDLIIAVDERTDGPHVAVARLTPYFESVERGELVALKRRADESPIGMRRIWRLRGWRTGWPSAEPR